MRYTRFISWAQGLYIAGLVLGLLVIIPSPWFPLQLGKVALAAVCMLFAAIFFVIGGGARSLIRDRNPLLLILGALLPLSYILSYFVSSDRSVGITGYTLEGDTVLFVVFGFLVFTLGLGLFRSVWSSRMLLMSILGAAAVAAAVQCVAILFGASILPTIFSDRSVNVIGKWNDLGLIIGLIPLYALVSLESVPMSLRRKIVITAAAIITVILLAIVNFPLVWVLLLIFSIGVAVWSFVTKHFGTPEKYIHMVPWVPTVGILVSGVLLLWGSVVNTGLTGIFPVSSLEVRPSMSSSLEVIKAAHGSSFERFMLGTGPQTYGQEWLMHKPASVNQSLFWNLDFNVGYSSFITALGSVGLLGVIAWLVLVGLTLFALIYALRSSSFSPREKLYAAYLSMSAIYVWGGLLFYVPSEIVVLVAFALTGATLGFVFNKRTTDEGEVAHAPSRSVLGSMIAVSVVLIVLVGYSTLTISKRYLAESHTNQGLLELQQGHADLALTYAKKAQDVEKTADDLRLGVDAGLSRLQQLAQTGSTPTQQQVQDFSAQAQQTIPQGQQAIQSSPKDYRAYVSLGRVYDFLNALGVSGAYDNAKLMYQSAEQLNPTNPQIPLLLARLEAAKGNIAGVQTALQQSLTLKPDYTDAILFVVQLNVAQKDIPNAIRAAAAAVQSAPGIPSIWFELGLLYYSTNDTASAIPPLEEAIKRQNDYANAKYFLGLSYAAQNRVPDAIAQFNDLVKTNPDNQEVKLILSNLSAGRAPFTNAQPPVTANPQNRKTAPISQ